MEQAGAPGGLTHEKLVAALQEECRVEKIKAEDFLNALRDLCVETLRRGGIFTLGKIGAIRVRDDTKQPAITFQASADLRAEVGLPEKFDGPLCVDCKKNPRALRRRYCHTCRKLRERAAAKKRKAQGR